MDESLEKRDIVVGAASISEVQSLTTQYDLFRFMKRWTEAWQMRAFMVLDLSTQLRSELGDHTVITNWPSELLQSYDNDGFLKRSNVIRELQRAHLPFFVDLKFLAQGQDEHWFRNVETQFQRFGMETAVWCPLRDISGANGAIGMSGARYDFTPAHLAEFLYIATSVFTRLNFIKKLDSRTVDILADREIDCLNWTASGKTSAEIAEIMQLSEHTVNHYLNRATKKLDTLNRTQAVAKALRLGIIK